MKHLLLSLTLLASASNAAITSVNPPPSETFYFSDQVAETTTIPTNNTWKTLYSTGKYRYYREGYNIGNPLYIPGDYRYTPSTRLVLTASKAMALQCYLMNSTNELSAVVQNDAYHRIVAGPFYYDLKAGTQTKNLNPSYTLNTNNYDNTIRHTKLVCRVSGGGTLGLNRTTGFLNLTIQTP